jgi:hypothetical protein
MGQRALLCTQSHYWGGRNAVGVEMQVVQNAQFSIDFGIKLMLMTRQQVTTQEAMQNEEEGGKRQCGGSLRTRVNLIHQIM